MQRRSPVSDLAEQIGTRFQRRCDPPPPKAEGLVGVISTGSTLLDLAISGQRFDFGGIPGGLLVEIFGPPGAGKTVLLCELAGNVQRLGGDVMFRDPEGRLNAQFAKLFDFRVENADYSMPNTVSELFDPITKWEPQSGGAINGVFADSLAALSTKMELEDSDKYGMRRAKEFSEQCRKVCRLFPQRNILMVCSNQIRQNPDARPFQEKFVTPGGEAFKFYSSVRLRCHSPLKMTRERNVGSSKQKRVHGVETVVEVYKNSVSEPHKSAMVFIDFTYGIDDIRGNLEYLKSSLGLSHYNVLGDEIRLGATIERAIPEIEGGDLQARLKRRTIEIWHEVENRFKVERRPKVRD